MAKPGVIAFPVLLVLGAITGYIAYNMLIVDATPKPGNFDNSPYYKELSESSATNNDTPAKDVDESSFAKVVTINILEGAVNQGNPDYDPDSAVVPVDALITWINKDSAFHSATSGTGFDDANYGKLFDSGLLDSGKEFSVPASKLGSGEHTYFCSVHPYMVGTVTVE